MKVTVHEGLSKLKLYEKRIANATAQVFVTAKKNNDKNVGGVPQSEMEERIKSNLESVKKLIANRTALKQAIITSNGESYVTVNGKNYSVAEAIERKNSIEFEKRLLGQLNAQLSASQREVGHIQNLIDANITDYLKNTLPEGSDEKTVESYTKNYYELHGAKLFDPCKVGNLIEAMSKDIENFESDVDVALSVSNATVMIDVNLE